MRLLLVVALAIAALLAGCSSTRLEAGSGGEAHAYANTSVFLVTYEGGLEAKIVDVASNTVIEEVRLDGTGERAWRRKGLLSFKWESMDPTEAKRLLGLATGPPAPAPPSTQPTPAPSPPS